MKEIKDYMPLYLGCDYYTNNSEGNLNEITLPHVIEMANNNKGVQLHLRPLSSITEEEAKYIFKYYFDKDYTEDWSGDTGSAYFNPKRITPTKYHALRIINGEDYATGDFMKVVQLTPYLLSKHFDLFGLIEAGLAIDKTKIAQ